MSNKMSPQRMEEIRKDLELVDSWFCPDFIKVIAKDLYKELSRLRSELFIERSKTLVNDATYKIMANIQDIAIERDILKDENIRLKEELAISKEISSNLEYLLELENNCE